MKVTREWLQQYFEKELPPVAELAEALTFHAFEIDSVEGDLLDVKVLPNRAADCLSHVGIAKELSAILNMPLKSDPFAEPLPAWPPSSSLTITVDTKKSARQMGALVRGVKIGPSPEWLKKALESVGQKSINNIVDATNYVTLNIGQPLHAFDANKIAWSNGVLDISVRETTEGEKVTSLAGEEYLLPAGTIVIAEAKSGMPLDIAGVKGGAASAITPDTTDLYVSVANFDGTAIRRTAQALKLFTDASLRFQNRPSPELCAYGMRDVLALIQNVAGGELEGVVDVYPKPPRPYKTGVSVEEVNQLLGSNFSTQDVEGVLQRLALPHEIIASPVEKIITEAQVQIGKPYKENSFVSGDAPNAFDCSSFIAWLFVQAGIRAPRISVDQYVWGTPTEESDLRPGDLIFFSTPTSHVWHDSQDYLAGTKVPEGVSHVALYMGEGTMIHAQGGDERKVVTSVIENYHLKDKIIGYRRPRGLEHERFVVTVPFERTDIRIREDLIEEVGRIIGYDKLDAMQLPVPSVAPDQSRFRGVERMKDSLVDEGFIEVSTQSFTKKGDIQLANPLDKAKPWLRTTLENNLNEALVQAKHYAPLVLPPNTKAKLFEVGTVFPRAGEFVELRMTESAWEGVPTYDNLTVAKLEDYGKDYVPKQSPLGDFKPFSIYPFVLRDIALWCPAKTESNTIEEMIRFNASELLVRADQFDAFEKEGRVSYAFRLVFESPAKTLTDEEINGIMEKIAAALVAAGYEVR